MKRLVKRYVPRSILPNSVDWARVIANTSAALKAKKPMTPKEVSLLTFSLSKLVPAPEVSEIISALGTMAISKLPDMNVSDISHLLAGFHRAGLRNELLFDLASREIGKQVHLTTIDDVTHILDSYMPYDNKDLLVEALVRRAILLIPNSKFIEPKNLTKLAQSIGRDKFSTDQAPLVAKLQAVLATAIASRVDRFDALAIAESAHVFAQQKNAPFLLQVLLDEAFQRRSEFSGNALALLVDAMGHIGHSGRRNSEKPLRVSDGKQTREIGIDGDKVTLLLDFFVSDLSKRGVKTGFSAHSLALLAHGLAKLSDSKSLDKLFTIIGNRVAQLSEDLTPESVSLLAKSFSLANVRHGPLLFNLPKHLEADIDGFSFSQIATVMKAYAELGIRNDTILRVVPPRCIVLLAEGDDDAHSALLLLDAYAKLVVSENSLQNKLVQVVDNHLDEFQDLTLIQNCIQTLQLDCPPILAEKLLV